MEIPNKKIGTDEAYFPIRWKNPYQHLLVVGGSGTGKSEFLKGLIQQDALNRHSVILVEPAGFLADDSLYLLNGVQRNRVSYCSLKEPVSINPMLAPYDENTISDLIAECINQVIKLTTPNLELTVKMRAILDEAVKYCLSHNRKSLLHVKDYIANLKGNHETTDGIVQRLNFLLNDERMHPILCGNRAVMWGELIQKHQSFILDCFQMSAEKMVFVGNLVSQGLKNFFRYERPKKYQPVSFYVDECQNFVNMNFMDILKEGRKYKLSTILVTQDFAGIKDDRLVRVMLNVGTLISFRVGFETATKMCREMGLTADQIQFIEKYHFAYVSQGKSGIAKAPRPPFISKRKRTVKPVAPKRESFWFPLEPYQASSLR